MHSTASPSHSRPERCSASSGATARGRRRRCGSSSACSPPTRVGELARRAGRRGVATVRLHAGGTRALPEDGAPRPARVLRRLHGYHGQARARRAWLERLGLGGRTRLRLDSSRRATSSGCSSRRRWCTSPKLLVLDEPFSGLDPVAVRQRGRHAARARPRAGVPVLFSSHQLDLVERALRRHRDRRPRPGGGHADRSMSCEPPRPTWAGAAAPVLRDTLRAGGDGPRRRRARPGRVARRELRGALAVASDAGVVGDPARNRRHQRGRCDALGQGPPRVPTSASSARARPRCAPALRLAAQAEDRKAGIHRLGDRAAPSAPSGTARWTSRRRRHARRERRPLESCGTRRPASRAPRTEAVARLQAAADAA